MRIFFSNFFSSNSYAFLREKKAWNKSTSLMITTYSVFRKIWILSMYYFLIIWNIFISLANGVYFISIMHRILFTFIFHSCCFVTEKSLFSNCSDLGWNPFVSSLAWIPISLVATNSHCLALLGDCIHQRYLPHFSFNIKSQSKYLFFIK